MIYGERTGSSAYYISADGPTKMQRVPFMSGSFTDAWLQDLIEDTPEVIPSGRVSAEYAPLLCIGRNVPIGSGESAGTIDSLYITPSGHPVIVEAKLFRSQESRRSVVSGRLDKAKALREWPRPSPCQRSPRQGNCS